MGMRKALQEQMERMQEDAGEGRCSESKTGTCPAAGKGAMACVAHGACPGREDE